MIECKSYNLKELREVLQFSTRQWENRKEELLEHLKIFFDYDYVQIGRGYCFTIYEQYAEYQPLPRKNDVKKSKEYYYKCTQEEVAEQPWNTGSNIARNLINKNKNLPQHQNENYLATQIRPIVKEKFVNQGTEKQWMRLSDDKLSYEPLTEEQLDYLQQVFKKNSAEEQHMQILGEFKSGYITKREASEQLFNVTEFSYGKAMIDFKAKYGFRPQVVKHLEENENAQFGGEE